MMDEIAENNTNDTMTQTRERQEGVRSFFMFVSYTKRMRHSQVLR